MSRFAVVYEDPTYENDYEDWNNWEEEDFVNVSEETVDETADLQYNSFNA